MSEQEKAQSWSEQLPSYIEGVRAKAAQTPVIFIDASQFDRASIGGTSNIKQNPDEIVRQVASQMETQKKGSSALFTRQDLLGIGRFALTENAGSVANSAKEFGMVIATVPSPQKILFHYERPFLGFDPDHFKNGGRAFTFEMYVESIAYHEATHAFHEGAAHDDQVMTQQDADANTLAVLKGEIPADIEAFNYIKQKYGQDAALGHMAHRTLQASLDKGHATSFFILENIDPKDITEEHIHALKYLASSIGDIIDQRFGVSAFDLEREDPQKFANALHDAIKKGFPQIVDLDIRSWSLHHSLAEKLKIEPIEVPGFIDDHPKEAQKAYDELKAEGVTKVKSIYTNPHLIKYLELYVETIQHLFKEDTPPKPKSNEPEIETQDAEVAEPEIEDTKSAFRSNAQQMFATGPVNNDIKPPAQQRPQSMTYQSTFTV